MPQESPNLLLASLSPKYRGFLMSRLKPVTLAAKEILYEADEVPKLAHFMTGGIASMIAMMSSGASAEVGICGSEGLVECFHLLGANHIPTRCFMQTEGSALIMPFKELQKEFHESDELRECILQNVQSQGAILAQLAACNRLHEAEERLARWFLMAGDRINAQNRFYLTQDSLAVVLGSRRTTVTAAASALQRKGLIRYTRGHIQILDRGGLEKEACECYARVLQIHRNFCNGKALNNAGRITP